MEVRLKVGTRIAAGDGMPGLELTFLHSANGRWIAVTASSDVEKPKQSRKLLAKSVRESDLCLS